MMYELPDDLFLILNETVHELVDDVDYIYKVTPISYEEYSRLMGKPYQYPPKRSVWRLITSQDSGKTIVELIGRFVKDYPEGSDSAHQRNAEYRMRYLKKPTPIILVNLSGTNLSIDGKQGNEVGFAVDDDDNIVIQSTQQYARGIPCLLPEGIHHEIVQRAVELATAVYNPQALAAVTQIGNISSTNLGIIPSNSDKR